MSEGSVFLLWYVKERDCDGADLLIGVYCTEPDAEAAIDRLKSKGRIRGCPERFSDQPLRAKSGSLGRWICRRHG